jgi:hypothetical protein
MLYYSSPAGHVIGLAHGASQHFTNGSLTKWRGCVSPYGQDGSVQSAPTYFGRFVPTSHTFPQSPISLCNYLSSRRAAGHLLLQEGNRPPDFIFL